MEPRVTILLVEDDPAHAEIIRRNLQASGVGRRLRHVADGQEALDYLFRQGRFEDPASSPRPDLVLLDLRLPKVAGLEVLRRLKADVSLQTIPVVVLTTSSNQPDIMDAYANRASSYLVKPADFTQFTDLMHAFVRYWLDLNSYANRTQDAADPRCHSEMNVRRL